jgi:3-oxoacyl-[acyl-carrier-protein] synthase-1
MDALKQGRSGIKEHHSDISPEPFYASLLSPEDKPENESKTSFENLILASALDAMQNAGLNFVTMDEKTGFILSTTKGNIHLIEGADDGSIPEKKISLNTSAEIISRAWALYRNHWLYPMPAFPDFWR